MTGPCDAQRVGQRVDAVPAGPSRQLVPCIGAVSSGPIPTVARSGEDLCTPNGSRAAIVMLGDGLIRSILGLHNPHLGGPQCVDFVAR